MRGECRSVVGWRECLRFVAARERMPSREVSTHGHQHDIFPDGPVSEGIGRPAERRFRLPVSGCSDSMDPLTGAGFAMSFSIPRSRLYFDRLIGRRDILGSVAALLASLAFSRHAIAADRAGRVEEIKGEAFADASNQHRPLEKMSSLYVGDRVETGVSSRLTMLLGEDTTIRLGERAHLLIDQFLSTTGGEISLQSGPMLFDRPSGSRPVPMKIKSPYGLIAVRGTKFFAGPSNGVFSVFVDHGTVVVSAGGGDVVLRAGEGTDLNSRGAKSTEALKWGKARIQAAFDSVN
jgi:hypothetical protein